MATTKDIANALGVDEQTVRRYAREGIIPFAQTLGGHRRYDLDEVQAALALARKARFEPLDLLGEERPRLASPMGDRPELRRRMRRRGGITLASLADAETLADRREPVPFIGVRGSTRCLYGQGTAAR